MGRASARATVDFKGEKRTNKTHESKTDPEARIYTKSPGQATKLSFIGHVLMENRSGLAVNAKVTPASYHAEHEAAAEAGRGNFRMAQALGSLPAATFSRA